MDLSAADLIKILNDNADTKRAESSARYFKTRPGQYGEGDVFIGLTMPRLRELARPFRNMPFSEISKTLKSPIHEHRMAALIILSDRYKNRDNIGKKQSYDIYVSALHNGEINNWDLVDVTAPRVVGEYAYENGPGILYKMAKSSNLWERRTAILSTFAYLKRGIGEHTFAIAEILLKDQHDLMHKAVGWLLREMGKCIGMKMLTDFLDNHYKEMPRTMLRYSLEKLSPELRTYYMKK